MGRTLLLQPFPRHWLTCSSEAWATPYPAADTQRREEQLTGTALREMLGVHLFPKAKQRQTLPPKGSLFLSVKQYTDPLVLH